MEQLPRDSVGLKGRHWMEMGEKPGKVQALGVEFSADCAAIRAKSGEGGYSETVDSWRKGVILPILAFVLRFLFSEEEHLYSPDSETIYKD